MRVPSPRPRGRGGARRALLGALIIAPMAAGAHPDEEPHAAKHEPLQLEADPREALADEIAQEHQSVDRALATVTDKLHAEDAARTHRLAAAYRILHAPLPADATDDDRMRVARRRAAARLLVERDVAERGLLATEADKLKTAETRTTADAAEVPVIALPEQLAWPAKGTIERRFGTFEHEKSKATLTRRGIDLEVEDHAPVVAPEAGTVVYAGPIRGLDHGVILDHGDFFTVVGKLGDLALPVGTHLERGDRIGRAARHRVYLEVRVKIGPGGLPIDPEPLLR